METVKDDKEEDSRKFKEVLLRAAQLYFDGLVEKKHKFIGPKDFQQKHGI